MKLSSKVINHQFFYLAPGRLIKDTPSLLAFKAKYPKTPIYLVSLNDEHPSKLESGVTILPFKEAISLYRAL